MLRCLNETFFKQFMSIVAVIDGGMKHFIADFFNIVDMVEIIRAVKYLHLYDK